MIFWGLVLARGSSKSVPHKNSKLLGDKPLIGWVLEPMKSSGIFDEIWVSTDDNTIESIAVSYGAKVYHRSSENATDCSSSLSSVQEFLNNNTGADYICLVQCTSPFLDSSFLKSAKQLILQQNCDSVFSVYRSHSLRWTLDLKPLNFDPKSRKRRQEWDGEYIESGHFYCFSRELALKQGLIQGGKCSVVEIPKQYCLEIDDMFDWHLALLYSKQFSHSNPN